MENFERPAELITKIKYDVDDVTYNKIGDWIEKDCNISFSCMSVVENRENCSYFRIMMDAILSGRREVKIEGLPSKREELEKEKFIKACEEKIKNNTFNNFDEDD
jgi:hypothetical protein